MKAKLLTFLEGKKNILMISIVSFFFISFTFLLPQPGLNEAKPIGAFLNGSFPDQLSTGNVPYEPAFPNITFDSPLTFSEIPAGNKIIVGQRDGKIYWFDKSSNVSQKNLILDLSNKVGVVWDGGFLGLTLHPEFGTPGNNYFYAYYCTKDSNGGNEPTTPKPQGCNTEISFGNFLVLVRYNINPNTLAVSESSEQILLKLRMYGSTHRGGGLLFGDDGFLYLTTGDQAGFNKSQDFKNNLDGGLLRLDVDKDPSKSHPPVRTMPADHGYSDEITGNGYWIPNDNPFLSPTGENFEEYYTVGHRNPHRMTKDRLTGKLYIGEVGGGTHEEINVIIKGRNYGWPVYEGTAFNTTGCLTTLLNGMDHEPPLTEFPRAEANSLIGGYVYRGDEVPELYGRYICADWGGGEEVWSVNIVNGSYEQIGSFASTDVISFGEDKQGEMYILKSGTSTLFKLRSTVSTTHDFPPLLSQTGAFSNLQNLSPVDGIIPYDMIESFWSDGAVKKRWLAIPNDGNPNTPAEQIQFSENGDWEFPIGTVLIKHFELPINENNPNITRRLETRFSVKASDGQFYFLTYKWNDAGTDAELLETGLDEDYTIAEVGGGQRIQTWHYPEKSECLTCHNNATGGTLGLRTRNLNNEITYPQTGITSNQLVTLSHIGLLNTIITDQDVPTFLTHKSIDDTNASLELRARSYMDLNCSYCHRPGTGNRGEFDLRMNLTTAETGLLTAGFNESLGIPNEKIISVGDASSSILYHRMNSVDQTIKMPPLAKNRIDDKGVQLIADWINQLSSSDQPEENRVTLYAACNYTGQKVEVEVGDYPNIATLGFSENVLSSLKIASGYEVTLYKENNFKGHSITLNANDNCLINNGFNDFASSLKVRAKAVLYADCNYEGQSISVDIGAYSNVTNLGFSNDVLSSLKIPDGYEITLYQNYNFGGNSITFKADDPCLANNGFDESTSSFKIRAVASIYAACNYGGQHVSVEEGNYADITELGFSNNVLSSLKLPSGYEITLYTDYNFTGNSITLKSDDECLIDHGFNDLTSSFKVRSVSSNSVGCLSSENIALGKSTTQSSLYPSNRDFTSDNAVDGNRNGHHNSGSLTHTLRDQNAWWEIDLGEVYDLSSISIWNRTDCCASRLSNFHVLISNEPFTNKNLNNTINQDGVSDYHFPGTAGRKTNIGLNNSGRYLRIQLTGRNYLQLAEVEIEGCPIVCQAPMNLAIGKSAKQSSDYSNNFISTNAIDGSTAGTGGSGSLTHTQLDRNAWWEIDLGEVHDLSSVNIWNRTDCCSDRLSDFYVFVSNKPFTSQKIDLTIKQTGVASYFFSGNAERKTNLSLNRRGRYLRVQLTGTNYLQLAEVEILGCLIECDNTENLSKDKPATQSSLYPSGHSFVAGNAVDGSRKGKSNSGSLTHTLRDQNAWWEVDLGDIYDLSLVKLWNRTDCCSNRLSNFHVLVSDEPFFSNNLSSTIDQEGVGDFHFVGTAGRETNVALNRTGRYLRVQLSGRNFLQLAEVEVYGCQSDARLYREVFENNLDARPIFGQKSSIQWQVNQTEESVVKQYTLQHLSKGLNDFENIETVTATSLIGVESYDYVHQNPNFGENFYRVKIEFEDDSFIYTNFEKVSFKEATGPITLAPNPAQDILRIDLQNYMDQKLDYMISSVQGQVLTKGNFEINHQDIVEVNLKDFKNGIYFIYIKPENSRAIAKQFVVAKDY